MFALLSLPRCNIQSDPPPPRWLADWLAATVLTFFFSQQFCVFSSVTAVLCRQSFLCLVHTLVDYGPPSGRQSSSGLLCFIFAPLLLITYHIHAWSVYVGHPDQAKPEPNPEPEPEPELNSESELKSDLISEPKPFVLLTHDALPIMYSTGS